MILPEAPKNAPETIVRIPTGQETVPLEPFYEEIYHPQDFDIDDPDDDPVDLKDGDMFHGVVFAKPGPKPPKVPIVPGPPKEIKQVTKKHITKTGKR